MTGTPYQVMPPLAADEFEALKADIAARGVQVPVEYDEMGNILDGHHRVQACHDLGITHWPRLVRHGMTEAEKRRHARRLNLDRRHLNGEQKRALIAVELKENPASSDRAIGAGLNVDHKTVGAVRGQLESTGEIPQLDERQGLDSRVRRSQFVPAQREDNLSGDVDLQLLRDASGKLTSEAREQLGPVLKEMRAEEQAKKKERRSIREQILGGLQRALPDKRYGVILADPEWRFDPYSRDSGMDRAADNHYPTSGTDAICARPVGDIAADDCVLFLWATVPMLPDALRVMAAWGFEYKSHCVWAKDRIGTGYWFRNQHEILLVGTRGNVPAPAMGTQVESLVDAPVGRHSEKPDRFYELIESYFPSLPKIELNARRARPGWERWGNEAPDQSLVDVETTEAAQ